MSSDLISSSSGLSARWYWLRPAAGPTTAASETSSLDKHGLARQHFAGPLPAIAGKSCSWSNFCLGVTIIAGLSAADDFGVAARPSTSTTKFCAAS